MTSKTIRKLLKWAGLIFLILIFIFPLIWMFSYSLRSTGLPSPNRLEFFIQPLAFENYWIALTKYLPLYRFLLNSILVNLVAVPLTVITASLAGFAMSQLSRRTQIILFSICILWMLVPAPAVWIPRFLIFTKSGLIDTYLPLIAPALMGTNPFYILLLYTAFMRISREVYESAYLDGAGPMRIWFSIAIPSALPSVFTVAILAFTFFWNDYISPFLYIRSLINYTLPVGIQLLQQTARTNYPILMAASVIMVIPIILIFVSIQRFFLQEQIDLLQITQKDKQKNSQGTFI